ncbi:MAG: hypothetical protein IIT54_02310, partial [Acetobacter sp.]|nr:hypothetical protein [Acetobacter sp.]
TITATSPYDRSTPRTTQNQLGKIQINLHTSTKPQNNNRANNTMLTKKIHKQLQKIQQQLQGIHQAFYGSHPHTMLRESQATMDSPSADIKFWESLPYHGTPGSLGIINWDKALIAVQHGNYMPLIAIYSQMQPQTWRNYFVNLYKWGQKMHIKAKINTIY